MTADELDDKTEPTIRVMQPLLIIPTKELEEALRNPPDLPARWAGEGEEPGPDDLVLYVIHNRLTSDFPGLYVMRREWVRDGARVVDRDARFHHDVEPLRAMLPPGLYRQPHLPGEDFTIEETWF